MVTCNRKNKRLKIPLYCRMMDPGESAAGGAEGDCKSSQAKGSGPDETP